MKVEWTETAEKHIDNIYNYIAFSSPVVCAKTVLENNIPPVAILKIKKIVNKSYFGRNEVVF